MLDFGFYNMDCMEGMKQFPDKYFDLAIIDPPYGDGGVHGNAPTEADSAERSTNTEKMMRGGYWNRFGQRFDRYKQTLATEERSTARRNRDMGNEVLKKIITWDVAPKQEYFEELFRISRNQIIWGGNYFDLPPTRCFLIWRKTNIPEQFSMAMVEYAWTSFNDNAKMFEFSAAGQPDRFHPTQKPVQLYKWILNNYSEQGDKILDTHVGSASSLIACHETGRRYVGFEIDEEYYTKAKKRLETAESQMNIFSMGYNPYQE